MGRHKTCPYMGGVLVGAPLVVALLWVNFPKSTFECRDMNLDLHKHKRGIDTFPISSSLY